MPRNNYAHRKLVVLKLNEKASEAGRLGLTRALQTSFGTSYRVVLLPATVSTIEIAEPSNG